ncbi:hypothetical protein MAPG_02557 [Magnaporthiopsis poae ATCC 64411]|uniref:Uncharacterized protein n=1 Tax=Magnaporthiopsis poae (strain ATCC 64411 / 73-15) TaxID=644358 RepID=A0A0C4DRP2_MAGP6|nr:hypothetical protein MAPG_02557 [Magnaporthiopsis poae ATCC 64411]
MDSISTYTGKTCRYVTGILFIGPPHASQNQELSQPKAMWPKGIMTLGKSPKFGDSRGLPSEARGPRCQEGACRYAYPQVSVVLELQRPSREVPELGEPQCSAVRPPRRFHSFEKPYVALALPDLRTALQAPSISGVPHGKETIPAGGDGQSLE